MAETRELRASDSDREHTAELLRQAGGEGRLDVEELDERLQQAFAARTRAELGGIDVKRGRRLTREERQRARRSDGRQ
jgi:hypothetical protein